ncbi:RIC1-domain-containing protein [Chytridium lagenaria]|nr:RIC1-domain-containing protein [Chytridium lagenaria]
MVWAPAELDRSRLYCRTTTSDWDILEPFKGENAAVNKKELDDDDDDDGDDETASNYDKVGGIGGGGQEDEISSFTVRKEAEAVDDGPGLIMTKPNVGCHLFVALTKNIVYLWCTRPHVMLSKVIRSEITIVEDGENQDVIWRPDSTAFVVMTNKGFLHFYDVLYDNSKSLEFQFQTSHHFVSGPGERGGVPCITIRFKMALEIDTGVQCGLGLPDELLLCTIDSPSILSLSWSGVVNTDGTVSLAELEFYEDPDKALDQFVSNMEMDLFAWISADGKAFITQRVAVEYPDTELEEDEDLDLPTYTWVGLCFYNVAGDEVPACSIAINTRYLLIAVGDISGQVCVYNLSDDRSELRFSHRLDLGFLSPTRQADLGPVHSLLWSSDCSTLAVVGSMEVFDLELALNLSLSRLEFLICSGAVLNFLFFQERPTIWNNVQKVLLISDDRLLLYEGNSTDFDPMNIELMQWESVQIPIMYISGNWPIRYSSFNDNGTNIAIAGRRGLAHYNTVSNKWKLFGSELQEQSFTVSSGGILWFDDIIIASTEDTTTWDHELRFFSREANLDTKCLHVEPMADTIISMSSLEENLLIFSADNVLRYFSVSKIANGQRLKLELHQQILLDGVVTNPFSVHSVAWNPDSSLTLAPDVLKKSPILLLKSGELSELRELADGGWEHIGLAEKIEYFWLSNDDHMKNSLWAVDGSGIKIWLNVDETFTDKGAEEFVQIPLDFYPLSAASSLESNNVYPSAIPFNVLFTVLKLSRNREEMALKFAKQYGDMEYFYHSLEILLHQVLDEEAESYLGFAEGAILPRLAKFLENFPNYLDVIVQCARKTEVSVWEYFFSIVGDAKVLFEKCLVAGSLRTATSYLIIIQTLEPISVSGKSVLMVFKMAVDLLEKAFDLEDFEIGKELIRFFSSIEGTDGATLNDMIKNTVMKYSISDLDINEKYHLDILLSKHARKLLEKLRIKALGRFSRLLTFPVVRWLKRERNRSAMINQWSVVLMDLHDQFSIPLPHDYLNTVSALYRQTSGKRRQTYSAIVLDEGVKKPPKIVTDVGGASGPKSAPPDVSLVVRDLIVDSKRMSGTAKTAFQKDDLEEISYLIDSPELVMQWRTALLGSGAKGYEELVNVVDETMRESRGSSQD